MASKDPVKVEVTAGDFEEWTTAGLVIVVARYAAGQYAMNKLAAENAARAAAELNKRLPPTRTPTT